LIWWDSFVPRDVDAKRVYYLSMEFLMGRSLLNALNNLGVVDQYTEALREMGYKLEDLIEKVCALYHHLLSTTAVSCRGCYHVGNCVAGRSRGVARSAAGRYGLSVLFLVKHLIS
jgi:hypothetical protein